VTSTFIAQRKLGFLIVFGLLLGIGVFQAIFLSGQFNMNLLNTDVLLVSEPLYLLLMSMGLSTLILIEVNNLQEFHIDKFTIITFILGVLLIAAAGFTGQLCSPIIGVVGIAIIIVFLVKKPNIPRTNLRWTVIGILLSSLSVALLAIVEIYVRPNRLPSELLQKPIVPTVLGVILRQFSGVSLEELLFRGFLWGYLRQFGWKV
jgi:hypothetical protein